MAIKLELGPKEIECLRGTQKTLEKINAVTEDIIAGNSIAGSCRMHGVNHMRYRRIMSILQNEHEAETQTAPSTKIDRFNNQKFFSFEECIYSEVFRIKDYGNLVKIMPEDAKESVEFVICNNLDDRERSILEMRYKQELTWAEIGEAVNLSRERCRVILEDAIRKLRYCHVSKYLRYGCKTVEKINEAEQKARQEFAIASIEEAYQRERYESCLKIIDAYEKKKDPHKITVQELALSSRSLNGLMRAKVRTAGEVADLGEKGLLKIQNLGVGSVAEIINALQACGIKCKK